MGFCQPGSYGSVCVGDFNSCSCEQQIPNPSRHRLQARDQETKLTSALVQSDPTPAQSLIQKATFSACNSNSYRVTYFFLEFERQRRFGIAVSKWTGSREIKQKQKERKSVEVSQRSLMESVEQPNDVHEQNTRDFQFDLPFWISAEMPQT